MTENDIFEQNAGLIKFCLKKYIHIPKRKQFYLFEDLYSWGAEGLMNAIRTFDESKGYAFSTYACKCIINKLKQCMVAKKVNESEYILFSELENEDGEYESGLGGGLTYRETNVAGEFKKLIVEYCKDKPKNSGRYKDFGTTYYLLYNLYVLEQPQGEIAKRLNCSRQNVNNKVLEFKKWCKTNRELVSEFMLGDF